MKLFTDPKTGYQKTSLYKNKKPYSLYIHRLILEAFVGPCPPGQECRHYDGHRNNNQLTNLSWGTKKENAQDKNRHGTGSKHPRPWNAKLSEGEVLQIKQQLKNGKLQKEIAKTFAISTTVISLIHRNKIWSHING